MPRDLEKDLEICNKATKGNWYTEECFTKDCWCKPVFSTEISEDGEHICIAPSGCLAKNDAEFIAEAREGWAEAIERAIKAEKAWELVCECIAETAEASPFSFPLWFWKKKCNIEYYLELASKKEQA